jgi:hypothetical protein
VQSPARRHSAAFERPGRWRHAIFHHSRVRIPQLITLPGSSTDEPVLSSVLTSTIASEKAAAREDVQVSGTFSFALIDEVGKLRLVDMEWRGQLSRIERNW